MFQLAIRNPALETDCVRVCGFILVVERHDTAPNWFLDSSDTSERLIG